MVETIKMDGRTGAIGSSGVVDFSAPDLANVVFYTKPALDQEQSRLRGMPWNKAMTYVRIQHPGEKDYIDRPVMDDDVAKMRWPRQWEAFERKQEHVPNGTPVECLFPGQPEVAANLHSIAIHTVQQLAGLTAHGLSTIGIGATQYQQKAKDFLSAANGGAGMHRLTTENEKLKNAYETQANQIALLKAQLDKLMAERSGVPSAMIPSAPAPTAQAHANLQPAYSAPELSDEPLFVEVPDELSGASISEVTQELPKRRGRPPREH